MKKSPSYELLVIILDDLEKLPHLLESLTAAGVSGATLLDSIGGHRASTWLSEIGLSGLMRMFGTTELKRRTLLAVLDAAKLDAAIAAAEQAVGGFGRPNSGILFTVPISRVVGLQKRQRSEKSETEPAVSSLDKSIRKMPVSEADKLLQIEPVLIPAGASLSDAVRAMRKSPSAQVGAVISPTGHLLGLVTQSALADHLFFSIIPELFYAADVNSIDASMDFGKMANVHDISDIMIEPVAVQATDTVEKAFRLMHTHHLTGLPVVDEQAHVTGFVGLLELLELVLERTR